MPEGHTIRRTALKLAEAFAGDRVRVTSPQGRFADGAALLDGRLMEGTDAWGKHLFASFAGGPAAPRQWHVHLGLYGTVTMGTGEAPPVRGAVRARLEGSGHWADLRGPITCEVLTDVEVAGITDRLGADPLRQDSDPERAWNRLSRSKSVIGQLLMDQSVVAGVGNVYRAEVLFRNRLSPFRPGREVARGEWEAIWADLTGLMRRGVRAGRIVTTLPGDRGRRSGTVVRADAHYVYRRAGLACRVCAGPVATGQLAGRNLFWCPGCQPA